MLKTMKIEVDSANRPQMHIANDGGEDIEIHNPKKGSLFFVVDGEVAVIDKEVAKAIGFELLRFYLTGNISRKLE